MNDDVEELPVESSDTIASGIEIHGSANSVGEAPTVRRMNPWVAALIGVGAGLVGLLPWEITGMRMPLQNLWAADALPNELPIVLLPFSQYALILIIGLLVTGAAVAGLMRRAMRERAGRWGASAMFLGLIVVQLAAIVQMFVVARGGLEQSMSAAIYLAGVTGVAVLAMLSGVAVFWLVSRAPRAGALVGFAIASVALAPWLVGLVYPFGSVRVGVAAEINMWVNRLMPWVPVVLIGTAIAWCGIHSAGRVIAALVSLLLLWIVPALATAISFAAGNRVFARDLHEVAKAGLSIFARELTSPAVLLPIVVSFVDAALVRLALQRRRELAG